MVLLSLGVASPLREGMNMESSLHDAVVQDGCEPPAASMWSCHCGVSCFLGQDIGPKNKAREVLGDRAVSQGGL